MTGIPRHSLFLLFWISLERNETHRQCCSHSNMSEMQYEIVSIVKQRTLIPLIIAISRLPLFTVVFPTYIKVHHFSSILPETNFAASNDTY